MKSDGTLVKTLWLLGDSIVKGEGREIHFVTKCFDNIIDTTIGGVAIKAIQSAVKGHMREIEPRDLVVTEGGGNAPFHW